MIKVFIDGNQGTTGLRIHERLAARRDVSVSVIPERFRKDPAARRDYLNAADVAFLCLPDDAAREAVALLENPATKVIDASTAHRTAAGWAYGFPELSAAHRARIADGNRIAVPGCHASGFVSVVYPLVKAGLLPPDEPIVSYSLTGYSGGGKKMIAEYEGARTDTALSAPRQYGLAQNHKHLPEMTAVCGLSEPPAFAPIVADYYSGMEVSVPLFGARIGRSAADVRAALAAHYADGGLVRVTDADTGGMLAANAMSGRDDMVISVCGNDERILVVSMFDNLGKGASGAALQCMNVAFGLPEQTGLAVGE